MLISDRVLEKAESIGVSKDQLVDMVTHAAKVSHPDGNRRYHDFVFHVADGRLCKLTQIFTVYEVCEWCDGDKCAKCNFTGENKVTRKVV